MMGAVDDKGNQTLRAPLRHKERSHQGHIGQMRTAQIGVIDNQHISRSPPDTADNLPHGIGHTTQMDRDMSRLGAQVTRGIENRTGEVQPVLDIGRKRRPLQAGTHLLAYGIDAAGENSQFHGIHGIRSPRHAFMN